MMLNINKGNKISNNWQRDIRGFNKRYGFDEWVRNNPDKRDVYLQYRHDLLLEELNETATAIKNNDPEEIVDGLIDICVIAIGTLESYQVDAGKAWDEVHRANMKKKVGVKPTRPNPLKLPDLYKPATWEEPSHKKNTGVL